MNKLIAKKAKKVCKTITSSELHFTILEMNSDLGPLHINDLIDAVFLVYEACPDVIRQGIHRLRENGLLSSDNGVYTVNKSFINESLNNLKKIIGVNE